jgi:CIC family chloride channel protein
MQAPVLGSIVLASATSWIVLHLVLGDEPLFHVPAYQLVHPVEFLFYAVLGLVGGLVSVCFVKLLLWQRKHFQAMSKSVQWAFPAVGGLTVGILGWFFPNVLGVGYGVVSQALNGQMVLGTMALLVLLKIVATATCYASGNAGGIFGPSLFIGAMLGGAVGGVAHLLMPDYTGSVGAYALVGMGAAFAGIVRVPLTSVIMIFEVTRDYSIIVPLMIANLISYFIASRLQEEPIYEALMHQDGISLPSGSRAREALLTVGHAFRPVSQTLFADERIDQAAAAVDWAAGAWPVVDGNGLRGMVTAGQLDQALQADLGNELVGSLMPEPRYPETLGEQSFPHVHTDHLLDVAMRRIATSGLKVLPVVSRENVRELRGTISVPDILAAYGIGQSLQEPASTGGVIKSPARLLGGLLAATMTLVILIGFLNYYFRAERSGRALRAYRAGNELMQKERYDEAIEQYRNALSVFHNSENRLALSLALLKAGNQNEAEIYLKEVLAAMPQSGPANRGLAQIYAQRSQIAKAAQYYQRAIDGVWPDRADENRAETRMELARLQK